MEQRQLVRVTDDEGLEEYGYVLSRQEGWLTLRDVMLLDGRLAICGVLQVRDEGLTVTDVDTIPEDAGETDGP